MSRRKQRPITPEEQAFYDNCVTLPIKAPSFRVGEKVRLLGDHPWSGNVGRVIKQATFRGKPSYVVSLIRNDAYDGHEVGVTSASDLTRVKK